jgi:hypothetical protein
MRSSSGFRLKSFAMLVALLALALGLLEC